MYMTENVQQHYFRNEENLHSCKFVCINLNDNDNDNYKAFPVAVNSSSNFSIDNKPK